MQRAKADRFHRAMDVNNARRVLAVKAASKNNPAVLAACNRLMQYGFNDADWAVVAQADVQQQ